MKPDKPDQNWNLFLYATNTGEFYKQHVAFARQGLSLTGWFDWTFTITNRYAKEMEPIRISDNDRHLLGVELSEYYKRHNLESDNAKASEA